MRRAGIGRRSVGVVVAFATGIGLALVAAPTASAADPCASGGNAIVCENSKPGTDPSVWDIDGAGDGDIQGFSTDISVNVGATIGFKVDTDAASYSIDIYRTGWYGGDGARKIASVTPSASLPQTQPQCMSDATTEIYDCGNWALSASWAVPSTAVSGVYVAKLTRSDNGHSSHITFIVRNDASHSQVLFKTSDTTWQAYNSYGGSDYYQGAANGRAYKISYNRPFVTRADYQNRDFYFSAEYPMVRFLERNGYDVTYMSSVDADRYGSLLLNHQALLSVGHDEYWSGAERANFEAARDAGVNLAFFSGNEVYWRTRWEPAEAGPADAYRTLVSYKETWSNEKIDPQSEWTGTYRDPRFAGASTGGSSPENALTGTMFMSNVTDLPVTVTAAQGKLRIWRGTDLTSMPAGTTEALAPHTVGYESDEDIDNGLRPAGLIDMSTVGGTVPAYMYDYGSLTGSAYTTHHITQYRAPSGALVFSAGSIQWSWGLDQEHDGDGAAADSRMQQATVNLLADMNAQPATLMSGLVAATASTDHQGPTVAITSPAAGASIPNGQLVNLTGTATDSGGGVVGGVEVSTDGSTWHPATGTSSWSYSYAQTGNGSVQVRVRATDDSGNIGAVASRSFTSACPCSIYGSTVPDTAATNDPSAVELGLRFSPTVSGYVTGVRFYKGAGNSGTHVGTLWSATGTKLASVTFTGETSTGWQTASFGSAVAVTAGTSYVVSYTAPNGYYASADMVFSYVGRSAPPLTVAAGYPTPAPGVYGEPGTFPSASYNDSNYYVDVVFSTTDATPLTATLQQPVDGASSVAPTTAIKVAFSKAASGAALTLKTAAGTSVAGTSSYDSSSNVATFTPSATLATSTSYVVAVTGVSVTGASSWTFTTRAADQGTGATTVSLYDESDLPDTLEDPDPNAVTLGVRFESSVSGTVSAVRFYKGVGNTGTHVGALWAVGGSQPLAEATFTDETTTGWQTVEFATPVAIAANTPYIASYTAPNGRYSVDSDTGLQRAPLSTDADSGQYTYTGGNPSSTSDVSYMVDVVFTADQATLAVVSRSPAASAVGVATSASVSIAFSAALASGASLGLKAGTTTVAGQSTRSSDGKTLTFTPSSALSASTSYTATATGLLSSAGATLADQTWSFTTASPSGCPCTIFGSQTPATTAVGDDSSTVELGVSFTPSQTGTVTGVRFYKGSGNSGTHTGSLWSSSGDRLATVTFSGESSSGWQTASFASPYPVTAGTTYVVSYLAPNGHYAATGNAFTQDVTAGPLTVPASGNGRYRYGGGFPTDTWQQTNYFVDVVFSPGAAPAPSVTTQTPAAGSTGISQQSTVTAILSSAPASGTPTIALSSSSGTIAGTSVWSASALKVVFTPTSALPAGTTISVATTAGGTAITNGAWSFTTTSPPTGTSLWASTVTPDTASWDDPYAVQVGTRFTTSTAGTITAIRFYKGSANTGTHTVYLWSDTGTTLAKVTSTQESASGWQTVALTTPVAITPGHTYTASYYTTSGRYSVTAGGLASVVANGPLSTVANGGAYVYGTTAPTGTSSAWYGVDVLFAASS